MRFMVAHKLTQAIEAATGPADPALVQNMGKHIGDSIKAGVFQTGAGLRPRVFRTRLRCKGAQCVVKPGPYDGSNELVAGFAMIKVKTQDEALAWARKFAAVIGDAELEVGLVVEGWDLAGQPKPPDAPLRFLILTMANRDTEAGTPPSPREQAQMGILLDELKQAGVLEWAEGVQPSALASRLTFKGAQHTVVDGPFAESKELISGFSIIKVATREEALAWVVRYGTILGDIEVDLLRLHDAAAFSG
jgi:hypothetical protein